MFFGGKKIYKRSRNTRGFNLVHNNNNNNNILGRYLYTFKIELIIIRRV